MFLMSLHNRNPYGAVQRGPNRAVSMTLCCQQNVTGDTCVFLRVCVRARVALSEHLCCRCAIAFDDFPSGRSEWENARVCVFIVLAEDRPVLPASSCPCCFKNASGILETEADGSGSCGCVWMCVCVFRGRSCQALSQTPTGNHIRALRGPN